MSVRFSLDDKRPRPSSNRVDAYPSSPIFRNMIRDCSSLEAQEIHFTDDNLERSAVLRPFLDMACDGPIPNIDILSVGIVLDLINLAKKYECGTGLRILRLCIRQVQPDFGHFLGGNCFHKFVFACNLDDLDTAARLLPLAAGQSWPIDAGPGLDTHLVRSVPGASMLDPASLSTIWIDRLPRKYFLALLRASRHGIKPSPPLFDQQRRANLASSPSSPWPAIVSDFKAVVLDSSNGASQDQLFFD